MSYDLGVKLIIPMVIPACVSPSIMAGYLIAGIFRKVRIFSNFADRNHWWKFNHQISSLV